MKCYKIILTITMLTLSTNASAALLERLGGLAYYDDAADLTWLANGNAGFGSTYDSADGLTDGKMSWTNATDWAANLNVDGVTGWRLPSMGTCFGFNCTASELGNMYYNVLGNTFFLNNTSPFTDVQNVYWTSKVSPDIINAPGFIGVFVMINGLQSQTDPTSPTNNTAAWAVQSGDVGISAVPVPTAIWLFGSGLLGLIGVARRKKA